jgi:hypothetical protein
VNLVGQNDHVLPEADLAQTGEILSAPAVAGWVLGIAEDEALHVRGDPPLEIVEVEGEAAIDTLHQVLFGDRTGCPQISVEAVVGGRIEEHLAARRRDGHERGNDALVHPRSEDEALGIDGEAVTLLVPLNHQRPDHPGVLLGVEVAPVLVLETILKGGGNGGRHLEVHVGNTHGHLEAAFAEGSLLLVPLARVSAPAVVDRIEVELAVDLVGGLTGHRRRDRAERGARGDRACESAHAGASQEYPSIESVAV